MDPLCKEGDFVLLDKLSYLMFRPRAGEVIVLRHPQEGRLVLKYIVKEKVIKYHSFYWVEGLNKKGSSDSRSFGWIPKEMILGKALIVRSSFPQSMVYGLPTNAMIKEEQERSRFV